jgi:hypothetical protein
MRIMMAFMIAMFGFASACSDGKSKRPKKVKDDRNQGIIEDDEEPDEGEEPEETEVETEEGDDFPREQSLKLFAEAAHSYLVESCAGCHGDKPTAPVKLAQSDAAKAHDEVIKNQKVNFLEYEKSRLVQRLTVDSHNCPGECGPAGEKMKEAVKNWLEPLGYRPGEIPKIKTAPLKLTASVEGPADPFEVRDFIKLATDGPTLGVQATTITDAMADEGATQSIRFANNNAQINNNTVNNGVCAPNNQAARAQYSLNVEKAGKYTLHFRAKTGGANRNTVCVQVGTGPIQLVTFDMNVNEYRWMPAQVATGSPLYEYELTAGANTIVVFGRGAANQPGAPATTQVTFNRIGISSRINEVFRGVQQAPPKPQELVFDLQPVVNKKAKIFMTVNRFDEERKFYGVARLRLVSEEPIKIEGVDILVNGKRQDFNKVFRGVKFDLTQAGEAVDRGSSVIQGENGFDQDEITLAFDKVE